MKYTIVFNLTYIEDIQRFLPNAYLGEVTPKGLGYMKAKATPVTIETYNSVVCEAHHQKAIDIIDLVSIDSLEEKYGGKGRRKKKLKDIFKEKDKAVLINKYIDRNVAVLLTIIKEYDLPLCLEIVRKVELETIKVSVRNPTLDPVLNFSKLGAGIDYQLRLKLGDKRLACFKHDTHLCTNDPAWVIIDYNLFAVSNINSAKLKPFLKKDAVLIPASSTKVYFEKFILQMASKLEINTHGFDVYISSEIKKVELKINKDFVSDYHILELIFYYNDAIFSYHHPARQKSKLHFGANDEIDIIKVERSEDEQMYVEKLLKIGLKLTPSNYFELIEEAEDSYGMVYWITKNYDLLLSEGFEIKMPKINDKLISLEEASIALQSEEKIDWFELRGSIILGDFEIPFLDLLNNIRTEDRFFLLPDGTYYIIPEAWMTKYSKLANFAEKTSVGFKIQRSNFMILDELKDEGLSPNEYIVDELEFEYKPSEYLKAKLRLYQVEGVKWLIKHQLNKMGACLADDMGLGKTLQTLALLNYTKDNLEVEEDSFSIADSGIGQLDLFGSTQVKEVGPLKALIVLPSSLVFNWYSEIQKFSPRLQTIRFTGSGRKDFYSKLDKFDIVLTTYGVARIEVERLNKIFWNYIILDESHMIKNKDSQSFKALSSFQSENKLTLTGTPIENSLSDLWSQMEFINPNILGDYNFFKKHYKTPIEKYKDEAVLQDVKTMIEPFILRRRKKDVAKDLPPLTKHIEYVTMSEDQSEIYKKEKNAIRNYLLDLDENSGEYRMHILASLLHLRQIANHPRLFKEDYNGESGKFTAVINKLESVLKSNNKVLIFSAFTSHLKLVENYLAESKNKFSKITGQTTAKKREEAVNKFQTSDDYGVFLISLKAGGVGLNLTAADYVFLLDPWWNPFIEEQAIARAHRIGQENPVTVMRFISKDTLEEKIIKLQARKTMLSADLLEAEEFANFTREDLAELLV